MSALPSLTAHSRMFIGGPVGPDLKHRNADLSADAFAGQDWQEIERPDDLGRLRSVGEATVHAGSRRWPSRATRTKASCYVESYSPTFALAVHLPGQAALLAAEGTVEDYAFRLVLADAPAGGTPSERLFVATVGGLTEAFDGPEDQPRLIAELWVNSNIVRVAATAGD